MSAKSLQLFNTSIKVLNLQSVFLRKNYSFACLNNLLSYKISHNKSGPRYSNNVTSQVTVKQESFSNHSYSKYWLHIVLTSGLGLLWLKKKTVNCHELQNVSLTCN